MTTGIRITNPTTGDVVLDMNDRLTTVLGISSTGAADGSVSVPEFDRGEPFILPLRNAITGNGIFDYPEFEIGSNYVRWAYYYQDPAAHVDVTFLYGVVT